MATNQQRREAAQRKLERQLQKRAEEAAQRRRQTILLATIGAIVVVGLIITFVVVNNSEKTTVKTNTAKCSYTAGTAAGGPVQPGLPTDTNPPATGTQKLKVVTSQGDMEFTLNRADAKCAVNSWLHLVSKKFYDNTPCHRLTTGALSVLQCGDPTGTGTGGPGYSYAEEKPPGKDQYPKGSIAMANSGTAGSTGSQFFICYQSCSSTLGGAAVPYSLVGTVDSGLDVVAKVAAAGSDNSNGQGDGKPKSPITITSITEE